MPEGDLDFSGLKPLDAAAISSDTSQQGLDFSGLRPIPQTQPASGAQNGIMSVVRRESGAAAAPTPNTSLSLDDAKTAPDGRQYLSDPSRPGQYLMVGAQRSPTESPLVPVYHDPFATTQPNALPPDWRLTSRDYGALEAITHGGTMGLSDQAINLQAATHGWVKDKALQAYAALTGSPIPSAGSFGEDYDRAAAATREARETYAREYPWRSGLSNVAGGIMLGAATAGVGAGAEAANAARLTIPQLIKQGVTQGAVLGAGQGAVQGAADTAGTEDIGGVAKSTASGAAVGAGTGAAFGAVIPAAVQGLSNIASWLRGPALAFIQSGREAAAGRQILQNASDQGAVRSAAALPIEEQQLVPGSQPTLFQLSGDPGLGAYERGLATKTPAPFNQQRLAQSAAQVDALKGIGPDSPDPDAIADYARRQLQALNDDHDTAISADTGKVQIATSEAADVLAQRQAQQARAGTAAVTSDQETTQAAVAAASKRVDPAGYGTTIRGEQGQRGTTTATASPKTSPEPPNDIAAQIRALSDPNHPKDAVFVANGNETAIPTELPQNVQAVNSPAGTLLTTDPNKAAYFQSKPNPDDADMAAILGYPVAKSQAAASGAGTVVQARDAAGNVIYEAATHPAGMDATTKAAQEQTPPGGAVVNLSPEAALDRRQSLMSAHADAATAAPNEGTAANPTQIQTPADIPVAERHINTEPTEAQQAAGNYQKGHATVQGIPVTIENPTGSARSGIGADGKPWSTTLQNPYGYIKRTTGADGDQVDAYLGPHPASDRAYVIDQHDPVTGAFDEHKVVLGAETPQQAASIYDAGFSDASGPTRRQAVNEMPIDDFKDWLKNGDTTQPAKGDIAATTTNPPASAGSGLAGARATAKVEPSSIFNALKAKNPALDISPLLDASHGLLAEKAASEPLAGEEAAIFGTVTNWPQVQSYKELQGIRSRISTAIAQDKAQPGGQTAVSYRLGMLREALDDAVATAAKRQATTELAGVKAGTVAPENTLYAQWLKEANDWKSQQSTAAMGAGPNAGGSSAAVGMLGNGSGNAGAAVRGQGAPRGGSGGTPGNTGVAAESLTPNWTNEYTRQYEAARSGWAQMKQTYDQGAVGKVLASDGRGGYKLADEQVGKRLFNAGATGQRDLEQAVAAAGHDPETMGAVQDYASSLLRSEGAVRDDGTIDLRKYASFIKTYGPRIQQLDTAMGDTGAPSLMSRFETAAAAQRALDETTVRTQGAQKLIDDMSNKIRTDVINPDGTWRQGVYQNWLRKNQDRLSQFPDIAEKFNTASAAQQTLEATQAAAKQARDDFQRSAAAKFINAPDPVDTIGAMLSGSKAKALVPQLVKQVEQDPEAVEGLKGLTMDWIKKKFLRGPENEDYGSQSIRAEAYKNFVSDKGKILEGIFGPDGVDTLRNVSNDLTRNARSYTEAKLPAGPGTAQDIMGATGLNQPTTLMGHALNNATKGAPAFALLEKLPIAGPIMVGLAKAMAENNIKHVGDLATQAVLNPSLAAAYFAKIPPQSSPVAQQAWAQRVANALTISTLSAIRRPTAAQSNTAKPRRTATP